jgi:hypothetical protein
MIVNVNGNVNVGVNVNMNMNVNGVLSPDAIHDGVGESIEKGG